MVRGGQGVRILAVDAPVGQPIVGLLDDGSICRWEANGEWVSHQASMAHNLFILDETEPKLREWKPEEVPFGCWIREKNNPKNITMVTAIYKGAVKIGLVGLNDLDIYPMHEKAEYSTDNGATWKPCGVME